MQMGFISPDKINIFSVYETEHGAFPTLKKAALSLGTVTLNHDCVTMDRKHFHRDTIFKEIKARSQPEFLPTGVAKEANPETNLEKIAERQIQIITDYFEQNWNPSKVHLMTFSSGYDSRFIASIIKMLEKKHGKEWLGEIHFFTFRPETVEAKVILNHIGWGDKHIPVREKDGDIDYWDIVTNFSIMAKNSEIFELSPMWHIMYEVYNILNVPYKNIQVISAVLADESSNCSGYPTLKHWLQAYHAPCSELWHNVDSVLAPFTTTKYIEYIQNCIAAVRSWKGITYPSSALKFVNNTMLDPELYKFPRMGVYRQEYSEEARKRCMKEVEVSWYGKRFPDKVIMPEQSGIGEQPGWYEYRKAAICQTLIENGVEIKV